MGVLSFRQPTAGRVPCLVFLLLGACGGSKFSAMSDTGGASNGGTAASGAGSSFGGGAGSDGHAGGGDTSNAGSASLGGASFGGASGSGGASFGGASGSGGSATGCNCKAKMYCQDGTNKCRDCKDFSRLEFAAPQKLTTLSDTQAGQERFPRAALPGTNGLFYRSGAVSATRIWYAPTPVSGGGNALDDGTAPDSGPLLTQGSLFPHDFFFDRLDPKTNTRSIMVADFAQGALSNIQAAPSPLNGLDPTSGSKDYSIAVASAAGRAYWMSDRTARAAPDLVWAASTDKVPVPVVLDLNVLAGTNSCPRSGDDATPWVDPDGTLLLFRNPSVDDKCTANDSGATDLFAVGLSNEGLPVGPAVALSALNTTGGASMETDPSLSNDLCTIYFASDNGSNSFDLYRAQRN